MYLTYLNQARLLLRTHVNMKFIDEVGATDVSSKMRKATESQRYARLLLIQQARVEIELEIEEETATRNVFL
jgi:hypothetical protein